MSMTSSTIACPASTNGTGKSKSRVFVSSGQLRADKSASDLAIWRRANQKWDAAGNPAGDGVRFWSEAAQEISEGK
jgi:hypothetical protein